MTADDPGIDRWDGIDAPILVMHGEQTWAPMPATMDALMKALPATAERAVLKGRSHFAAHSAPQLFAGILHDFFRRNSTQTRDHEM